VKGVLQLDVDGNVNIMWALFKDKNDINEKNVIGFASFIVMTLFAIADLMTSLIADKDLIINEVVYNSFVWVTLGCFGISAVVDRVSNGLNIPCGCEGRREALNIMFPYKNK